MKAASDNLDQYRFHPSPLLRHPYKVCGEIALTEAIPPSQSRPMATLYSCCRRDLIDLKTMDHQFLDVVDLMKAPKRQIRLKLSRHPSNPLLPYLLPCEPHDTRKNPSRTKLWPLARPSDNGARIHGPNAEPRELKDSHRSQYAPLQPIVLWNTMNVPILMRKRNRNRLIARRIAFLHFIKVNEQMIHPFMLAHLSKNDSLQRQL